MDFRSFPCLSATFGLGIFLIFAFHIEKSALEKKITERKANLLNVINISASLISPSILIYLVHPLPSKMISLIKIFKISSFNSTSFSSSNDQSHNYLQTYQLCSCFIKCKRNHRKNQSFTKSKQRPFTLCERFRFRFSCKK